MALFPCTGAWCSCADMDSAHFRGWQVLWVGDFPPLGHCSGRARCARGVVRAPLSGTAPPRPLEGASQRRHDGAGHRRNRRVLAAQSGAPAGQARPRRAGTGRAGEDFHRDAITALGPKQLVHRERGPTPGGDLALMHSPPRTLRPGSARGRSLTSTQCRIEDASEKTSLHSMSCDASGCPLLFELPLWLPISRGLCMDGPRCGEPNRPQRTRGAGDQSTASPKTSLRSRAGLLYLIGLQGVSAKRIDRVTKSEVSKYSR